MSPEEKRRHLSALATNVVAAAMDLAGGRVLQTTHDAETRDAIYALLQNLQDTEATTIAAGDAVPLVATHQGAADPVLDSIESRLSEIYKAA